MTITKNHRRYDVSGQLSLLWWLVRYGWRG